MSLMYKIVLFAFLFLAIFAGSSSAVTLPFSLTWERNSESDLAFYTVYHGTASRDYNHFGDVDKPNPYFIFDESYLASKGISIGPGGLNLRALAAFLRAVCRRRSDASGTGRCSRCRAASGSPRRPA